MKKYFNMKKLLFLIPIFFALQVQGQVAHYPLNEWSVVNGAQLTSGTLTSGLTYIIGKFETGDDFSNIGGTNESGDIFVATGTTPTTWTNGSILRQMNYYTLNVIDGSKATVTSSYPVLDYAGSGKRWYEFDGVDDYIDTDYSLSTGTGSYSIIVKLRMTDANDTFILFDSRDADNDGILFRITSGTLQLGHNALDTEANYTFEDNTEYVVAASVTYGSVASLYVNKTEVPSYTSQPTINTSVSTTETGKIARNAYTSVSFSDGDVYMAKIFNTALTADEVAYYSNPANPLRENQWWEMAPQLSSQTYILSLVEYNGKLYGGTGPNGKLFEWNGTNAWVEVAPQLSSQTRINSLAEYNGKLYGGTYPNGKLFEWNGTNSWVEVAPQLSSQTDILSLVEYNGKLYGGTGPNGKLFAHTGLTLLNLNAEGAYPNIWYDHLNEIEAENNGATRVVPAESNLGAMWFNGTDSKIALAEDLVIDTNNSTISFWAKKSSASPVMSVLGNSGNSGYSLIWLATTSIYLETDTNGDAAFTLITPDTNFNHYTFTFNSKSVQIYINGIAQSMSDSSLTDDTITIDQIGLAGTSDYMDGQIKGIRYYNKILSQSQVTELYNKYRN